jgi:guanylate kinase
MLTQNTLQYLDKLYKDQDSYRPSKAIAAQLASKQILVFVGPTCVGKNTIMEAIAATDEHFKIAGTFTSRDPRPNEKGYTYYENTDEGLRPVLTAIEEHRVVQYAVNPHAHTLYGSELEDYPGEFNVADVFSSAVSQFKRLGFQKTITFSLATDPIPWLEQFERRFPPNHPQRKARRDEAIESIEWSLSQSSKNHFWLINIHGKQAVTAERVIAFVTGASEMKDNGRGYAVAILRAAQSIQV